MMEVHGASRATVREGGRILDQPPALREAEAAVPEPALAADVLVWESDVADLTTLPFAAVDSLPPLRPAARILDEVLRSRSSIRGGGEPGRAE
jgi:hypothetical protein